MIDNEFWNRRIEVTRMATLPAMYAQMKQTGRWDAMRLNWKEGDKVKPHIFWDSDIAKMIESICFALRGTLDSDLEQNFKSWLNDAIDMIRKAQKPEGYINIYYSVVEPDKRWTDLAHGHELYCAGHLLEAAIAHNQVTGSNELLDIICRYIDYICAVFGPNEGQLHGYPGHPEIELALVKLISIRNEAKYLNLLEFFINERGKNGGEYYNLEAIKLGIDPMKFIPGIFNNGKPYPDPPCHWSMQAEAPIRELVEIKGHSVRAMYLLAGAQGLANIKNDDVLNNSVKRLWNNMMDAKLYIHGGIGSQREWEGFGPNYDLPLDCYAETCASLGILFLGKQMLEHNLDGKISSVMQRALYNDCIGGVSLDGKSFYYDQPLVGRGMKRSTWFSCSCCPPNLARVLNDLDSYVFTEKPGMFAVNMWMGGSYNSPNVSASLKSEYPFKGEISIDLVTAEESEIALYIPDEDYTCNIEGELIDGYLKFSSRKWNHKLVVSYPLKPQLVHPSPKVEATKGMVAVERGPFVYGVEQMDSSIPLNNITFNDRTEFIEEEMEIEKTKFISLKPRLGIGIDVRLVPYFVLGNRKPGDDFKVYFKENNS